MEHLLTSFFYIGDIFTLYSKIVHSVVFAENPNY